MRAAPPDVADTESMMLSGSGALLYTSTFSVGEMISSKTDCVSDLGRAIESANLGEFKEAAQEARAAGIDPNGFCYRDRNGMWFTPILAILARNTKKHLSLAQSILKEGPESGWDLSTQRCWVMCPTERTDDPVLLDFEQALPVFAALNLSTPTFDASERAQKVISDLKHHLAKWGMDWNRQSEVGHTALMELVRRAPLRVARVFYDGFLKGMADPFVRNDEGMSALDYLEERLEINTQSDPLHAVAGRQLLSDWRAMLMEGKISVSSCVDPTPSKSRAFRF